MESQYENKAKQIVKAFYDHHDELHTSKSHGFDHAIAVYSHSQKAIQSILEKSSLQDSPQQTLTEVECMEIRLAALMHDVDDKKYFTEKSSVSEGMNDGEGDNGHENDADSSLRKSYSNATKLLEAAQVPGKSIDKILYMIDLVSCSKNGNSVPSDIKKNQSFHLLIPRWSDRLEAVGKIGVVRCYRYNCEKGFPLFNKERSPKPQTKNDVWSFATAERFDNYISSGGKGTSNDMISHYYDKLLHIARPPRGIVQNEYLENAAEESSEELVEICMRYGLTGEVDVNYILELERSLLE
mmetsp:Transcript_17449/g.26075  ORF Transcript_17449/g.26075 Transcript_17449/m.26075 type:complete len:297 (-) Transcript_17449:30-920(-)